MSEELSESKILKVLDWSYDIAVNGVSGLDSASEMAEDYMNNDDSSIVQANSLIRWQNTKAGTSGFLTGLGGIITMPIALYDHKISNCVDVALTDPYTGEKITKPSNSQLTAAKYKCVHRSIK
jgi:hypothetical protein